MVKVGIIGCGKIAQVRHIPEYLDNPNAKLTGLYDLNLQRAKELAEKNWYFDWDTQSLFESK